MRAPVVGLLRFAVAAFALAGLALASGSASTGCAEPAASPADAKPAATSGSALERYFPLEDNKVYAYNTEEHGETGILTARAHRLSPSCGELVLAGKRKRFCYAQDEITSEHGNPVLKVPLAVGTTWSSSSVLRSQITAIGVTLTVPAGTYTQCIEVTERAQAAADTNAGPRTTTTYCPQIGIAKLEVVGADAERATVVLKSYAAVLE
jgi:hypothetical protein